MIRPVPSQVVDSEWIEFPGGELEGTRPKGLCQACRARLNALAESPAVRGLNGVAKQPLCFQCYRVELDRNQALRAAGQLNTASEERFQSALPFEPVNTARLERLRADRLAARAAFVSGTGQFIDKRRRAQIAARHALQRIAATLAGRKATRADHAREMAAAIHAAELQLPESWLPFVVSR